MTARTLHDSATAVLETWSPAPGPRRSLRAAMLAFLASSPRACLRDYVPGHITASAMVFSQDERYVLLTLHPRVGMWIQLGGHCEEHDDSVPAAALREATEESGIAGLSLQPGLYDVAAHPITCSLGVPTNHLDLIFEIKAPAGAQPVRSAESTDLRWWPVDALPADTDVVLG